jgi:hypothetical protein
VTTVDDIVGTATEVTFNKPLVTNVFRSVLVEAIVAAALPDWDWCSSDYASWDFQHRDRTRLEVKQSAARQTWFTGRASSASWDVAPRTGYWKPTASGGPKWVPRPGRCAHIYVLAHHPVVNRKADHRDARQWLFYVVATSALPKTKSLSQAGAAMLADAVTFEELASRVELLRISVRKRKAREPSQRSRGNPGQ